MGAWRHGGALNIYTQEVILIWGSGADMKSMSSLVLKRESRGIVVFFASVGISYTLAQFNSSSCYWLVDRDRESTRCILHGAASAEWKNTRTDRAAACAYTAIASWAKYS